MSFRTPTGVDSVEKQKKETISIPLYHVPLIILAPRKPITRGNKRVQRNILRNQPPVCYPKWSEATLKMQESPAAL